MNDYNNTNFWDVLVVCITFIYLLSGFAGTAYLIVKHDWSAWWMLFALLAFSSVKIKTGG